MLAKNIHLLRSLKIVKLCILTKFPFFSTAPNNIGLKITDIRLALYLIYIKWISR